jgi:hypothetical protein
MSAPDGCTSVFHFADECLFLENHDGVKHLLPEAVLSHSKLLRDVFDSHDRGSAPVRLSAEQVQAWLSFISAGDGIDSSTQSVQHDAALINILHVRPDLPLDSCMNLRPFNAEQPG